MPKTNKNALANYCDIKINQNLMNYKLEYAIMSELKLK